MKLLFVTLIFACIIMALAKPKPQVAPQAQDQVAQILRSEFDQDPAGAYTYNFETDNGITRNEVGDLKSIKNEEGEDEEVLVVRGSYSYVDPSGQLITVNYIADENGFRAEGDHIPKPARR